MSSDKKHIKFIFYNTADFYYNDEERCIIDKPNTDDLSFRAIVSTDETKTFYGSLMRLENGRFVAVHENNDSNNTIPNCTHSDLKQLLKIVCYIFDSSFMKDLSYSIVIDFVERDMLYDQELYDLLKTIISEIEQK